MLFLFLSISNMIACVWGLLGAGILKHFVCLTLRKFCQPDSETQPPYIEYFFINQHPSFSLYLYVCWNIFLVLSHCDNSVAVLKLRSYVPGLKSEHN